MLRLRRYRIFLLCAILLTVLLFRLSHRTQWEGTPSLYVEEIPNTWEGRRDGYKEDAKDHTKETPPPTIQSEKPVSDVENPAYSSIVKSISLMVSAQPTSKSSVQPTPASTTIQDVAKSIPHLAIPDRKIMTSTNLQSEEDDKIYGAEYASISSNSTPVYWERQVEHFPVPTESIISLPSGNPVPIPKIQHKFADETPMGRVKREERLGKVKSEFKRAWKGYRSQAWLHDELSPVSGKFRDPFGRWAATLVDSLDTLWIMGLEEDFDEAVRAVAKIDFTTVAREEIQVFETTIRYLGGLLAAFDVSGGTKRILLEKAVELAEVLMGVFDTPNRMPVLFYRWKPAFASQPHRASAKSNLAELGTLSMEFTRLAQLTKKAKYYDAVARITNAFEEWQNRGTGLPGVFPTVVDASGCNRSISLVNSSIASKAESTPKSSLIDPQGYEMPMPKVVEEPRPKKGKQGKEKEFENIELSVTEGEAGEPGSAHIWKPDAATRNSETVTIQHRDMLGDGGAKSSTGSSNLAADSDEDDWDCVPQGLDSGMNGYESYSMGSGQDSSYEYLPKQYLLLGGLEEKYRIMYLKAMDAVRKSMLYRPMLPDNRDILFSGKATALGNSGMFGMGAKIFDLEEDLEIAKKLTDGCVWAYESMPSGIMPEASKVLACQSMTDCSWNQTFWEETLDPASGQRDQRAKDHVTSAAKLEAQTEAARLANQSKQAAEKIDASAPIAALELAGSALDVDVDSEPPISTRYEEGNPSSPVPDPSSTSESTLQKRQLEESTLDPASNVLPTLNGTELSVEQYNDKLTETELELNAAGAGRDVETPSTRVPQIPIPGEIVSDPSRPMTHKEYISAKIEQQALVPGYVHIQNDKYILRPEAIESVWYMYRITGDQIWQEKGWKMFESIIKATSTTYGHSAVKKVTNATPTQLDEMESFWLSETLKYFYLLFSTPDKISLDEWVLNTEAHPFKRLK